MASSPRQLATQLRDPFWQRTVREHLRVVQSAASSPSTEAYATMWYGDTTGNSFDGLKVLLHSIRGVDAERAIVIMTPVEASAVAQPESDPNLLLLQRAVDRVVLERMPLLTIFKNTSTRCPPASTSCGGSSSGGRSYLYTYSKFGLWGLTRWSRLMYLDIDLLVMRPLDTLWRMEIGTQLHALVAASLAIRAKAARGLAEFGCAHPRASRWAGYNTGLVLLQPSRPMGRAMLEMVRRWKESDRWKNPCRSDQTYFNYLFPEHTRCLPYSANCRDPQFLNETAAPDPRAPLSRLTRCLEPTGEANASSAPPMDTPYAVHFACNSKPWLPHNQGLFFARAWLRHLAAVNARIAAASREAPVTQQWNATDT